MLASANHGEKVQLTDRINRIQISPTAAVIAEADKLKARGVDVADFGPGEPDFPTPDHIKKAAIKAIDENKTKYTATAGIMPLREAICAWHKRELGSAYEAERMRRQRRRQAFHFQSRQRADSKRRRSHHSRALLGQLSRTS